MSEDAGVELRGSFLSVPTRERIGVAAVEIEDDAGDADVAGA